jgi:hypothetical protein
MLTHNKIVLSIALMLFAQMSFSKTATFSWDDELCTFKGQYDDRKVSATQLQNTAELLRSGAPLFGEKSFNETQLDEKLASFVARMQNKNAFVQQPAFDVLRTQYQAQAEFWHELEITKRRVTESQDYASLAQFRPQQTRACLPIVQVLSNPKGQLERANAIISKDCYATNADPAQCTERQMRNPIATLLNYSWHNCANNAQPTITHIQREKAHKAFRAQFHRIKKQSCDEP